MARKKHDDPDDGTDWLLAQLVTGRTPESEQRPQDTAAAEPPAAPEPAVPAPEAAAPAQPDLPLRQPSPRREEVLDWFSLAEPSVPETDAATRALPVIGQPGEVPPPAAAEAVPPTELPPAPGLPAWSPPFVSPPPPTVRVTQVEPPVGETPPRPVEQPPGPVTPTGPFALQWGSNESEVDDSARADQPAPRAGEPPPPTSAPTPPPPPTGAPSDPFAGFTPPPVARSSFTPVANDAPRHPTTPDSAPRGWDERAAEPPSPAAYDDELWAALHEPEPEAPPRTSPASTSTPPPAHPGIALSLPLVPPPAQPTPLPAAAPTPFPAFVSDRGGQPTEPPQGGEQIDDLLAELGNRWAAREAASAGDAPADDALADAAPTAPADARSTAADGAPPAAALASLGLGFDGADDGPGDSAVPDPTDEGSAAAESSIARQVAEAGYFWNLTPDPTAADPNADISGAAATINRLRATSPEPAPQLESEPAPAPAPAPELGAEPEPEFAWQAEAEPDWEPEYPEPAAEQPEYPEPAASPGPETSDRREADDEPGDHDPLAALFGGAAATPLPARPSAPLNDPFAYPAPPASASAAPATAAPAAGAPFAAPVGVAAGARSAHDVANHAHGIANTARGGSGGSGGSGTGGAGTQGGRRNSPVRILTWIAGGLVAVLVLTGLFFLGTQIGGGTAAPAESPSASATPTPAPEPTAAQPAGVHAWDTLFGGECLEPFVGPFEEEFTVIDCAAPHAAQLVYRGVLPGDAAAPFPGEAELASQMNLLCTASGVINLAAVTGMEDLQVQASYPVTAEQWAEGERHYYCFANRAGGEPLTASIAGPGPAA